QLAPAFEERDRYGGTRLTTRNISRFRRTVWATSTHPWLLANGERTDALAAGQFLPSMRVQPKRDGESYRLVVVHGLVVGAGSWRLRSTDHAALEWLEQVAPYAGFVAVGSGEEGSRETNYGVRTRPIRWLYLATREVYWRVMSVEEEDGDFTDTFCAVVPGK